MNGNSLAAKLESFCGYGIVFTVHAELRLAQRQVERELVISHLRNPVSLRLVERMPAGKMEEKYKLWFVPSKRIAYIYVVVINHSLQKIIVKTVIKQRLLWQKGIDRHAR